MAPRTQSGLPEPAEDASQFFLYRVQLGAGLVADLLSADEINGLLEPAAADESSDLATRIGHALAAAFARDREQAGNAARFHASVGERHEAPEVVWRRHRAALLEGAPASRLRDAVAALQVDLGLLARMWRAIRGS